MLRPSISTVHAAQKPAPHPNFTPCTPSTSRSTESSEVLPWRSSTSTSAPLTLSFIGLCRRSSGTETPPDHGCGPGELPSSDHDDFWPRLAGHGRNVTFPSADNVLVGG